MFRNHRTLSKEFNILQSVLIFGAERLQVKSVKIPQTKATIGAQNSSCRNQVKSCSTKKYGRERKNCGIRDSKLKGTNKLFRNTLAFN